MALDYRILAGMRRNQYPTDTDQLAMKGVNAAFANRDLNRLKSVMNQELAGDPTMQAYSAMDPVAALKMMRGSSTGRPMTEGQRKKYEFMQKKWDEKMANKAEADEVSNRIIELENQAVDVINSTPLVQLGGALSPIMKELYPARNLYQRRSGKPWQSSSTNLIDQKFKETKEGRAVSEDRRQDVKFAEEQDKAIIKSFQDRYSKLFNAVKNVENALQWASQAAAGSPVAAKNFMAALSRAGSDEALSDSERDLLEYKDLGSMFEQGVDKLFISGRTFSAKTLKSAYESGVKVIRDGGGKLNKIIEDLINEKTGKIKSNTGREMLRQMKVDTENIPPGGTFVSVDIGSTGGQGSGTNVNVNQSNTPRKAPPVRKSPTSWGKPPGK